MVTSAPKDFQALANSQPMTPPPSTIADAGHVVEVERVLAGDHALPVELEAGQRAGVGAAGQDEVLSGVGVAVDANRLSRTEPARALDDRDLATLDQALQAFVEPPDGAVLVGVDAGHVDAFEGGLDAELLSSRGSVGNLAGVQQGLGRDAAAVQAGAADLVLLDQDNRLAELGGPQRCGIAAAAAAEDDEVGLVISHCAAPARRRCPGMAGRVSILP